MVEELQVSQPSGQFKQLIFKKINQKIRMIKSTYWWLY